MGWFDYCKAITIGLFVVSVHIPAYMTINLWNSIPVPPNCFDARIWVLLSVISFDILLVQSVFFAQTLIYMRLKIITIMMTLPVFAILTFSSAVLNDTNNYKEYKTGPWLQATARNINIAERYYGLYLIGYLACSLRTHFNSFAQLKIIAKAYVLIFCGLVLCIGFIPIFKDDGKVPTVWLLFSMISILVYIITLVANFVYTPGNFKIFGLTLMIGFIPNLYLSIKGLSLTSPIQMFTDPLVRYAMLTILNLIWWTITPSLLIVLMIFLSLIFSLCCRVHHTSAQPQDLLPQHKVRELVYFSGLKETAHDIENPINGTSANKQDNLIDHQENNVGGECSICWENFSEGQKLLLVEGCNHTFHQACLQQWCERDARCPMCRINIEKNW